LPAASSRSTLSDAHHAEGVDRKRDALAQVIAGM